LEVRRGVHSGERCGKRFLSDAGAVAVHLIGSLLVTGGTVSILCRATFAPLAIVATTHRSCTLLGRGVPLCI
jgi:hypothetical protein